MSLDKDLAGETEKWMKKSGELIEKVKPLNQKGREFLINIKAYYLDSRHFMERKDIIRAFEAIIWCWAWLEIGKDIKVLKY